jgi:hypothetical protein
MPEFTALLNWMQDALVADHGLSDGLATVCRAHGIDLNAAVVGSNRLPAGERVAIYARGYVLRLLDCLRQDFPLLRRTVGDQVFDLFALAYIRAQPSRSYTLYDLGAGFAGFLDAARPADGDPRDRLPADLARLERAQMESQRGRGPERLADPCRELPAPLLLAAGTRLRLPDTVRLLRLGFDLTPLVRAVDQGMETLPFPELADSLIAVGRSRYSVRVHPLDPTRFAWLQALGTAGGDAAAAMVTAARACDRAPGSVAAEISAWLPWAFEAGLVSSQ